MVKGLLFGLTEGLMKALGKKAKCMEEESVPGQTVNDMRGNTSLERKMVKVLSNGLENKDMMESGKTEFNTEKESTQQPKEK